jgi:arylsulfatase A-like enzyme
MAATGQEERHYLPNPLLLALWLALVAGLAEGGFRLFQRYVLDKVILMSPHVIWMAPVADLIWIGVPALLLLVLRRFLPRLITPGLIVVVLAAIAFLPLVLLYTTMHKLVSIFLALALGYQASRMIMARPDGFNRLVRATVVPLGLIAVLSGVAIDGFRAWRERQELASLPAARAGLPNVLLIIWDTVRGQSLSAYGYERPTTPFLQSFAAEGARFDLAMSTAPWTLPSHGAMFTGQRPLDLMQSIYQPTIDTFPLLSRVLAAHGYATGGFVANMAYTTEEHGLGRGFSRYEDYKIGLGNIFLFSRLGRVLSSSNGFRSLIGHWEQWGRKSADEVSGSFLDWSDDRQGRPFFAFLNYFDAHQPYIPPEPFRSRFMRDSGATYHPHFFHIKARDLKAPEIEWLRDNYDAAIAYLDDELRKLLAELGRRGVLDNTIVIISSDHGEHLGDHKRVGHMNSLYRTLLQVPLIIRYPAKIPSGTVVGTPVSLRDLPKTVLDLTGVADSAGFPGATLARFWNGAPFDSVGASEPILAEIATRRGRGPYSLIQGNYHYIAWQGQDKAAELYRIAEDPWETTKLTDTLQFGEVLASFRRWSTTLMGRHNALPRDEQEGDDEGVLPQ